MSDLAQRKKDFGENNSIKKLENVDSEKNDGSIKNYSILSILKNRKINSSLKSENSSNFNFKENEIKKFDELNNSLRKISNFDLEKGEEYRKESFSFCSSKNDDDGENNTVEFELITKEKIGNYHNDDKIQYELELNKEFEEIEKEILMKKN
jgi:hypothetical protein